MSRVRTRWSWLSRGAAASAAWFAMCASSPAEAQVAPSLEPPSNSPDAIPVSSAEQPQAPNLEPAPEAVPPSVAPDLAVNVRAIHITGNSVLASDELASIAQPYTDRSLSASDIQDLAGAITDAYVSRGYVASGATVPDQDFAGGVLELRVVEGRVGVLRFEGQRRLRRSALQRDVLPDASAPLNVRRLEDRLRRLQQRPEVRSVHAELRRGAVVGEATLIVRIEEDNPFRLAVDLTNYRSPALGQVFGGFLAGASSPAGIGDDVEVRGQFGAGLNAIEGVYRVPLTRWGTLLALSVRYIDSEVVDEVFAPLDIESDFLAAGFDISQPLWWRGADDVRLGLRFAWRRSQSSLGGLGFSFSEGADRGTSTVAALRPYVSWLRRSPGQVMGFRLMGTFGVRALGATDVPGRLEDGQFIAGLLQAQWARRFESLWRTEFIARTDVQLASQPLLSIEQFSIGGQASVRGYRANAIVRDNGYVLSIEARVPVFSRPDGAPILQVAPFFDVGRAWDKTERPFNQGDTLIGIGAGLRYRPLDWLDADLYYGYGFNDAFDRGSGSAQDVGLYFRIVGRVF